MNGGVYQIINKITGKFYVGRSKNDLEQRWKDHWSLLKRGLHHSVYLQNAWNKYGEDAFIFQPIDLLLETEEEQKSAEQEVLDTFWDFDLLYNMSKSANGGSGSKSEETRKRMSKSKMGQVPWNKGIPHPEERRQQLSEVLNNKPKKTCPHCGKDFNFLNYGRWHGDNCKHKKE